jgi:hypothetical protein
MNTPKAKVSTEFKKKLRQEYDRLKTLQGSQEKEVIEKIWSDIR